MSNMRDWSMMVRRIRDHFYFTQAEFAREIGVSTRTVQEWEAGRSIPRARHRRILQNAWDAVTE